MGTIRVEFTPVKSYYLGLLKFDHIQIVYQDETSFVDRQDRHCVANAPTADWPKST